MLLDQVHPFESVTDIVNLYTYSSLKFKPFVQNRLHSITIRQAFKLIERQWMKLK